MSAAVDQSHTAGTSVLDRVGDNIIHHVSNSSLDHPLIHLPQIFGINFSVTKHVLMLWIVTILLTCAVIIPVRKYLQKDKPVPSGWMNVLESIVKFFRDSIVQPNIGSKYSETWAPLILTFFFFILFANGIGLIPVFDLLGALSRFVFQVPASAEHNLINSLLHGGVTATGTWNTKRLNAPSKSKTGINPMPFANRMKKKNVRIRGAHVSLYFEPILGCTIESRKNFTIDSRTFIQPLGTGLSFCRYFLTGIITAQVSRMVTIHNISTCLVTEKLIPKIWGK
jgi:hypothetical protein